MKRDAKLRVVGYVRVSTDRQAAEGQSLGAQEDRIRAYAAANDLNVDTIYQERGVSGKNTDRPALSRLRSDLDSIGVVIVYKFDRISRSVVDLYELVEEFRSREVEFRSVTEGVDTGSPVGKFVMATLASLAQMERELIGERTRETLAHKKSKGEHCGRAPFGYQVGREGKLVQDNLQQKKIARAKRLRREGKSIRSISGRLGVSVATVHKIVSTHGKTLKARYAK